MFKKKKQWSVLENEVGRKSGTQGSSYDSLSISLGKLPLHLCISAVPSLQQKCFIRWHPVTVFILFHRLFFCLRDLMRLLTYKLKKSWVDHYLVLFSSQQIVVLNHLLQPSWLFFTDPEWKVFSAPPGFVTFLLYSPSPQLLKDRVSAFTPVGIHPIPSSVLILS